MKARTYLAWILRDSRGSRGRMLYFAACLAVGVAAVVGTAALSDGLEKGFQARSREMLGADLTVDAQRPLPPELDAVVRGLGPSERSDCLEAPTMVLAPPGGDGAPGRSRLALLFAVEGRYPLYGTLATDPPGGLDRHLTAETVVPEAALLDALGLAVGDTLNVGGRSFRIAAAALGGPAETGFSAFLGPRVYLDRKGFDKTPLLPFGSRVRFRALFALPGTPDREALEGLAKRVEAEVPDGTYLDVDTHYDRGGWGRRGAGNVERFIQLVALLSLVIGGIGVAQIVRTWLAERTGAIAVMRCLGATPAQILLLSVGHTALLALAGSLVGAALGCVVPALASALVPDLLPAHLVSTVPVAAVVRGLALGVGLALAFSLPALMAIWRVPPARVLRASAEPLPPPRGALALGVLVLAAGVFGAAWMQADDARWAGWFTAGFGALVGLLFLAARTLVFVARRLPRRGLPPYLVHGVTAVARPGSGTSGAIVALGLGTMVVVAMGLVETKLREALLAQIPAAAPNMFFLDLPPESQASVRDELERAGAEAIDVVPVVMARIRAIDGRPASELANEEGRTRWSLRREQRLTSRETLTPDNRIVRGSLWSDPDRLEVSVEERTMDRLGLELGSTLELDVRGTPLTLHVTSVRSVEWQSFAINFFLVAEPGALDGLPTLYLANAHVPPEAQAALQDRLTAAWPNLAIVRVGAVAEQAFALVERLARGIRLLGLFAVLAGVAILAGTVSATALRRGREVALLKTLGVTRRGVALLFVTEYGLCGVLGGAIGAGGAMLLAWAWLTFVADQAIALPVLAVPAAALACGLLTAISGVVASARALTVRPIQVLR